MPGEPRRVNPGRVRKVNSAGDREGPVVYWMSRDQRSRDNWALLFAQELALSRRVPLAVAFCLAPDFLGASDNHYRFMLEGLTRVESALRQKNIVFHLLVGRPPESIARFCAEAGAGCLVSDFDPLRKKRRWKEEAASRIDAPFYEVDAHNIVPCWAASDKQEYAARTIRPKIHRRLDEFLEEYPPLLKQKEARRVEGESTGATPPAEEDVTLPAGWVEPGEDRALRVLDDFLESGLEWYAEKANDPNGGARSCLSPYLHFGQVSAQRVALEVMTADAPWQSRESFLEELVVRKELSDNYCYYNPGYDSIGGFPSWARETLEAHRKDPREYLYDYEELEAAATHDQAWNAAQTEMVTRGRMHGYMRMYWAKKILEWTATPEVALGTAIRLNDSYQLDGRDPNGYTGIAWSIGGVHDRGWKERPVFGKIRYMSFKGLERKFDVRAYIDSVRST
jgi:deoxyribodipyrimidine photo-lyase